MILPVGATVLILTACPGGDATQPDPYVPGRSYFGANDYVEYIAGDLPLVFTAAHGGLLAPADIPVRTEGACGGDFATVRDSYTQELTRDLRAAFFTLTGKYPHIVINRLSRDRLDANRPLADAACGDPRAETAWNEYHDFIEVAKARILAEYGRGWYTDIHGHGHAVQRLELGYRLGAATLRRSDAELDDDPSFEQLSSFRSFSESSPLSLSALLRGPKALGTLLEEAGYPSVPSQQDPAPLAGEEYFSGGYNTQRHACATGGQICGVQIEANMIGVRNTALGRETFALALVNVYAEFLWTNFAIALGAL
ncbi:MAG TPA: hypothetical protein VMM18_15755 [Gemmatimonadaceae bacterium]|nr:hypothetical protein [Gemmatimonadaceae bacterium]